MKKCVCFILIFFSPFPIFGRSVFKALFKVAGKIAEIGKTTFNTDFTDIIIGIAQQMACFIQSVN